MAFSTTLLAIRNPQWYTSKTVAKDSDGNRRSHTVDGVEHTVFAPQKNSDDEYYRWVTADCKWSHLWTVDQQEFEPFLATSDDPETHGQQLYAALVNGDHGTIAAEGTFYWWDESTSSVKNSSELTYG